MNAFKTLCQQMKYDPFKKRNRKINRISVAVAMMIFPSACAIVYAQGKEPFTENGVWFWFPVFVALCLGSIAVLLPWRTLGRWLWRWWNGREFERKPLPVGGAVALNQDPLRYSDSAKEAPVGIFGSFSWKYKDGVVHGGPFCGQTLDDVKPTETAEALKNAVEKMRRADILVNEISKVEVVNPTETPEQFVRRICPNAKLVPYGQKWRVDFGEEIDERGDTETWNKHHTQEEAWQDAKDELLWYGNDAIKKKIANPLAGLTAEQIAARVNRGEPVRVKDAVEALGFKRPTSDDAIISDPVRIKAEMLRQHMEGHQQGTTP